MSCQNLRNVNVRDKLEAVAQRCSVKKLFSEISQNSQENTCARFSFLIKLKKEALAQVSSYEFCEIFKNIFFDRTHLVAVLDKNNCCNTSQILLSFFLSLLFVLL